MTQEIIDKITKINYINTDIKKHYFFNNNDDNDDKNGKTTHELLCGYVQNGKTEHCYLLMFYITKILKINIIFLCRNLLIDKEQLYNRLTDEKKGSYYEKLNIKNIDSGNDQSKNIRCIKDIKEYKENDKEKSIIYIALKNKYVKNNIEKLKNKHGKNKKYYIFVDESDEYSNTNENYDDVPENNNNNITEQDYLSLNKHLSILFSEYEYVLHITATPEVYFFNYTTKIKDYIIKSKIKDIFIMKQNKKYNGLTNGKINIKQEQNIDILYNNTQYDEEYIKIKNIISEDEYYIKILNLFLIYTMLYKNYKFMINNYNEKLTIFLKYYKNTDDILNRYKNIVDILYFDNFEKNIILDRIQCIKEIIDDNDIKNTLQNTNSLFEFYRYITNKYSSTSSKDQIKYSIFNLYYNYFIHIFKLILNFNNSIKPLILEILTDIKNNENNVSYYRSLLITEYTNKNIQTLLLYIIKHNFNNHPIYKKYGSSFLFNGDTDKNITQKYCSLHNNQKFIITISGRLANRGYSFTCPCHISHLTDQFFINTNKTMDNLYQHIRLQGIYTDNLNLTLHTNNLNSIYLEKYISFRKLYESKIIDIYNTYNCFNWDILNSYLLDIINNDDYYILKLLPYKYTTNIKYKNMNN